MLYKPISTTASTQLGPMVYIMHRCTEAFIPQNNKFNIGLDSPHARVAGHDTLTKILATQK